MGRRYEVGCTAGIYCGEICLGRLMKTAGVEESHLGVSGDFYGRLKYGAEAPRKEEGDNGEGRGEEGAQERGPGECEQYIAALMV